MDVKAAKRKPWKEQVGRVQEMKHYLKFFKEPNVGRMGKIEETSEGVCDRLLDMGELNTENSRRITQLEIGSHKVQAKGGIERQQGSSFLFS